MIVFTPTPTRLPSRLLLSLGLILGLGSSALAACFVPPSGDVLFACELDGDDACPPDYACEADNCCHRVGSEVKANQGNWGSCALGGNSGGGATDTSTTAETGSDSTDTGTDAGTGTGETG
jgi:hypothetical protein